MIVRCERCGTQCEKCAEVEGRPVQGHCHHWPDLKPDECATCVTADWLARLQLLVAELKRENNALRQKAVDAGWDLLP